MRTMVREQPMHRSRDRSIAAILALAATRLAQHKLADGPQFILHEHELAGLPGMKCDLSDGDGPIWLPHARTAPNEGWLSFGSWTRLGRDRSRARASNRVGQF